MWRDSALVQRELLAKRTEGLLLCVAIHELQYFCSIAFQNDSRDIRNTVKREVYIAIVFSINMVTKVLGNLFLVLAGQIQNHAGVASSLAAIEEKIVYNSIAFCQNTWTHSRNGSL